MGTQLEIPGKGGGGGSGVVVVGGITALTGDVLASGTGSVSSLINNKAVKFSNIVDVPTQTFLGRNSTGSGIVENLTIPTAKTMLGVDVLQNRLSRIRSTGLITGGELSINGSDTTKIDIAEGAGLVVDNHTDPLNPVVTEVSWSAMIGVTDPYIATDTSSYISINSAGALHWWGDDAYTDEDRRDYIILGWTSHVDHIEVDTAYSEPQWCLGIYEQLEDFLDNFGSFNITGNDFSAYSGLTIQRTEGKTFDNSTNYANTKKSPNIIISGAETSCPIYYYYRTGIDTWKNDLPGVANINPNKYDNGTGLSDVPSGYWTIQVITYYAPTNAVDVQYGQSIYGSYAEARSGLGDVVDINPYNLADTFRTWLLVRQGAADLANHADADFVSAGRLGLITSAVGGGSGGEVNTASNIGASGQGLFEGKIGVDLQFRNIDAGSTKLTVIQNATQHTVELDVDSYLKSITQNLSSVDSPNFAGMTLSGMSGIVKATGGVLSGGTVDGKELSLTTRVITTNDSISTADFLLIVTGTYSVSLPTAIGAQGRMYMIKSISGTTTLTTALSQTIDGSTSLSIRQWECYNIVSDGSNWVII
jgi:hypothetical protein